MIEWIEGHPSTTALITALLALAISVCSLALSLSQRPEDPLPVVKVIEDEARLTREGDVDGIVQLFTDDAKIRDVGFSSASSQQRPSQSWIGKDRVRERYEMIRDNASFPELEHVGISVTFDPAGQFAIAISSTQGRFRWQEGEIEIIDTVNGERWTLVRLDEKWKIKDVSFHMPPPIR